MTGFLLSVAETALMAGLCTNCDSRSSLSAFVEQRKLGNVIRKLRPKYLPTLVHVWKGQNGTIPIPEPRRRKKDNWQWINNWQDGEQELILNQPLATKPEEPSDILAANGVSQVSRKMYR
jgi:hypothetical protein